MKTTLAVLTIFFAFWTVAEAQTTHTVRAGETLFSISRQYDISVQHLREWNNLADNTINVGQRLIVSASEAAEGEETASAQSPETITHVVEAGQTLYRISTMYGVSVDDVRTWNQLESNNLSIGQELNIQAGVQSDVSAHTDDIVTESRAGRVSAPPSVTAEWDMESSPQGRFVTYTIGEEDSLEELLTFHQMDRQDFRALNPGISPSDIQAGDEVTLLLASTSPQRNPYRVRSSDREASEIRVARYPDDRRGQTTTSGDLYNPEALTAAHPGLSLGSVVFVENPETGHGLFVLINDRTSENRMLLSDAAFRALQFNNSSGLVAKIDDQLD